MGTAADHEADIGPVDFYLVEFPGSQFRGEIIPELIELVDSGLIRILELMLVSKAEDGSVVALDAGEIDAPELLALAALGAGTLGVLDDEDVARAAEVIEPGSSAAVLVFENLWAIPTVNAVRRAGGHVVATGRIPAEDLIDALTAAEAAG